MRHLRRLGSAAAALAALMALMTGTALAGGWAAVTMVDGSEDAPVAGEEREIRFSLLQHGVTPVDHGRVQLTASLPGSDERISVAATSAGGGEWIATVAFPVEGDWLLAVTHSDLETSEPTGFAVGPVDGTALLPGALSVGGFVLLAVVILGATVLVGRRRQPPAAEAPATTVRAG